LQVFISYSHNESDTPIARFLAAGLRAAGMKVWHDESSQPAGEPLQSDIEAAIRASDCAIFIVSKLWLDSRWGKLELNRVDQHRERIRRVPILRMPYASAKLPMELIDLKAIPWLEDDPHHDAKFWEVFCAVTDRDPGPPQTWAVEGEKIQKGTVPPPAPHTVAPTLESLRCNRAVQWNRITDVTPEPSHDLLIVPGAVGQAHEHFSRRVREMLLPLPPRSIVSVHWRKRPVSREEHLAVLAGSMGIHASSLVGEMAERMSDSNLILLHPCIAARFVDPVLVSYYTEWLPALLTEVKPRMSLKCIQPVAWVPHAGGVAGVLTWLRLKSARTVESQADAERLIAAIRKTAGLRGIRLQELANVTEADLDEFCQLQKLTDTQKQWFLEQIRIRDPKNAEELFDSIDAVLPDARSVS
jgi:TIR domain